MIKNYFLIGLIGIGLLACNNTSKKENTNTTPQEKISKMTETKAFLTQKSNHDVATTADRLEAIITEKGLKIFTRINHAANASNVELELRPTELILFGNPKLGTPLMQCNQSIAIDLPQKALIFENEKGETWIQWNNPIFLEEQHQLEGCNEVIQKVNNALKSLMAKAAE